mmetsp:Transcript_20750/g.50998  ORF Transcript_20750/g.50998 Transcript_20750/m.50998 type:complete len:1043 (+) Transcript_20750:29-3157(+)
MPEATLPSVSYADYKRAIRGSKRKSDATQSEESIKEEASAIVKSTSQYYEKKKKKGTSNRHSVVKASKSSKFSSSVLQNDVTTSPIENTVQKSAQIEENDVSQKNQNEKTTARQNTTPAETTAEDEGFEVFGHHAEASDELETSLTIHHTLSGESESHLFEESEAPPQQESSPSTQQNDTNTTSCDEQGIEVHDSTLQQQQQQQQQQSADDKEDHIQITESISYKSNDDSIFSKEGPKKEASQRNVVHTSASSSASEVLPSPVSRSSAAIDMTGCIRRSFSPDSSSSNDSIRSNNIRQLEFPHSPNKRSSSQEEQEQVEEVSSELNNDQRWQDFGTSLTLLGAPVLSWFSTTTSDGVVANDHEELATLANHELTSKLSQENDGNGQDKQQTTTTTQTDASGVENAREEVVSDTVPVVDDDKTSASTSSSSSSVVTSKKLQTTSSLSSTDAGSLSSHDVVGEVADTATTPRVEIPFPRQLSRLFSNREDKNNNHALLPSKKDDENPKRRFLFAFGFYTVSLAIFIMLMFMVMAPSDETAVISAGNTSTIEATTTLAPTVTPSMVPSDSPSLVPSKMPTNAPTITARPTASQVPSTVPSEEPSHKPSIEPSDNPTVTAVPTSEPITYVPGKLTVKSNGLKLSEGLTSRIVARSGQKVFLNGRGFLPTTTNLVDDEWNTSSTPPTAAPTAWFIESDEKFHFKPDGAAAYLWPENDHYNGKGWIYVGNAEVWDRGDGGVGAIYFDDQGRVVDYKMLLNGTTANCSGGKTPWHTWVTCEEADDGRIYQVDPLGIRPPVEMTIGMGRGKWESFAYDIRDQSKPRFFATEDKDSGTLRRFTPDEPDWDDPWNMLQANGTVDFLVLEPFDWDGRRSGTFFWSDDLRAGKDNARRFYQNTEGIDVRGNQLFVVSKVQKELFILDLDAMTYEVHSTVFGMFDGQPDQMKRLISDDDKVGTNQDKSLLYFCEEGGRDNGIHARDSNGWYFTILESDDLDGETSGLAFSPDGKHMYFSYQHRGIIFDVWREDGRPFHGKTLSVKYHETGEARSR